MSDNGDDKDDSYDDDDEQSVGVGDDSKDVTESDPDTVGWDSPDDNQN